MRRLLSLIVLFLAPPTLGQSLPVVTPDPKLSSLEEHPSVTLGHRAETVRSSRAVERTLVLAPNARAALNEIARWEPGVTWPVLIDDGSERACADIARFVQVFRPLRIVFAPGDEAGKLTRDEIQNALAHSWGAETIDGLQDAFARANLTPPGVVVTDPAHAASIGALALASGRGQPIVWTEARFRTGDGVLPNDQRDALLADIESGLKALPYAWNTIADDIDAITLCLSTDGKVKAADGKVIAITDRVGRTPRGHRWAYAGWIPGSAQASLYDAMCALFVRDPGDAWIFDGYSADFAPPYACARISEALPTVGIETTSFAPPANLPADWRAATRTPLDAGLVHVNSSGDARRFELGAHAKRCYASDIPALARPAIVHFIHSFSAARPASDDTIANRWLDEGAYAYLGSVDEPLLGAFQTGEAFLTRMLGGAAFGAAVRRDRVGPWRTQVFGDPLVTISKGAPRAPTEPVSFEGYQTIGERLQEAASARDLNSVLRVMLIVGRHDEALRIARASLVTRVRFDPTDEEEEQPRLDPEGALLVTLLAERTGRPTLMRGAARRVSAETWDDRRYADRLWRLLRPSLEDNTADSTTLSLLRSTLRSASAGDDAVLLARNYERVFGRDAADAVLRELRGLARWDEDIRRIDALLGH